MTIRSLDQQEKLIEIDKVDLENLQSKIRGHIILPTDTHYDSARAIWNAMIDRKPTFIVQCLGTADVIEAVKFAKKYHLLISIRGAGHNIAGKALQNNVMLIDLSLMRSVYVNPETKTAWVSPGATLGDVDHETQAYGLALPVGVNSTTGIAGLTLGGGFGWLSRKFGMTIDNVLSIEVITVDGERLSCDKNTHSDLFWGLLGESGNFAIVTKFEFQLHPVGPEVMCGPIIFQIEDAKDILTKYRSFCESIPDELSVWAVTRIAPPFPFLDKEYHGKPILILPGFYTGAMNEGKEWLDKVAHLGHPIANAVAPHQFKEFQSVFDPLLTPGARNYWKTHNFLSIDDALIDLFIQFSKKLPGVNSEIFLAKMGGAATRITKDATAFPHRDAEFVMNVHTRWENPEDDEECISWARDFYKKTLPYTTGGAYVNFVSEGDDNIDNIYGDNARRLKELKIQYDPKNILRSNFNIAP